MTQLRGSPPAHVRAVLERVVGKALSRGAQAPPWVGVDDGTEAWVDLAARTPAAARARVVVAVASEEALRRAIRLGLGGAVWLPPSTLAMEQALVAAAQAAPQREVDPALVDVVLDRGGRLDLVTLAEPATWCDDLGFAEVSGLLAELASCLGVPPALVGGSALLAAEPPAGAVRSAWEGVVARVEWAVAFEPRVSPVPDQTHERRSIARLTETLTRAGGTGPTVPRMGEPAVVQVEGGVPKALDELAVGWDKVVRVPVWASRRPRSGSPTGLLLERMAAACELRGVPLWVPLVDRSSLPFVLRLPGRVWLDGPAAVGISGRRPSPAGSPSSPVHG